MSPRPNINMDDLFRLISGQRPPAEAQVTVDKLNRTRIQSVWTM